MIKPKSEQDFSDKIEKLNYSLLKESLQSKDKKSYDLTYIGQQHEKYSGVIMTLKAAE